MEADSAIGKSEKKRAAWCESTKATVSQAGWSWWTKAKFRSKKKHSQSELSGLKKFINFHFDDASEWSFVCPGEFYFPNYMWLGVLTGFHQFIRLKQIFKLQAWTYLSFPLPNCSRQISSLIEILIFPLTWFQLMFSVLQCNHLYFQA